MTIESAAGEVKQASFTLMPVENGVGEALDFIRVALQKCGFEGDLFTKILKLSNGKNPTV